MSNLSDLASKTFPGDALPPAARPPDAERREVILRFEQLFSGLESHIEDQPAAAGIPAHFDFPDDIASVLTQLGPRDVTVPVQPRNRREPELASKPTVESKPVVAKAPEPSSELDIDEALSILREAEAKGKATAARAAKDEDEVFDVPFGITSHPANSSPEPAPEPLLTAKPAQPANRPKFAEPAITPKSREAAPASEGPGKSQMLWTMALIAASVALTIGTGVGYLMGRGHEATISVAKIPASPAGGAKLRADYDLRKR